jgi:dUTP pyrophosphatase
VTVRVKVVDPKYTPTRGNPGDAGLDLRARLPDGPVIINPGRRLRIPSGVLIAIQPPYVGLIWPRSGLADKAGIQVMAGCIDVPYRGEIGVLLYNSDLDYPIPINDGDRIAQLLLVVSYVAPVEVVDDLDDTERGAGGFGSTGVS